MDDTDDYANNHLNMIAKRAQNKKKYYETHKFPKKFGGKSQSTVTNDWFITNEEDLQTRQFNLSVDRSNVVNTFVNVNNVTPNYTPASQLKSSPMRK